jgi:D-alanine-D-alanine ligase
MTDTRLSPGPRVGVVVIGGGQNCEHDVSLASARSVAAGLDPDRYDVSSLTIGLDGGWLGDDLRPLPGGATDAMARISVADVVFPAVHGPRGEDGTLAGLCELAGVPYVGSGVRAGALAMDKWATKLVAEALGIKTAHGRLVTAGSLDPADDGLDLPLVVKPVGAGSSHGVRRVETSQQLGEAVLAALALDDRVLVEELVRGREIDVAVLEWPNGTRLVGPPLEVVNPDGAVFDTERKYDGTAEFLLPAAVTDAQRAALSQAAVTLFGALGCAGAARFDFFLTSEGLVLNEVNTMPGMTAQSQVPKIFAAVGLSYPELLDVLIECALLRRPRPATRAEQSVVPLKDHAATTR